MIVPIKTVALPVYLSRRRYREYDFFARFPVGFTRYGGRDHPVVVSSEWNISITSRFFCFLQRRVVSPCTSIRRYISIRFLSQLQTMNTYMSLKSRYKRRFYGKEKLITRFLGKYSIWIFYFHRIFVFDQGIIDFGDVL